MGNGRGRDTVYCFNLENGRELWSYSYNCAKGQYPGPRATPTYHDGLLYTQSREGHVFCLDAGTGGVVWRVHIGDDLQMRAPGWGFASSPLIHDDLLILNAGSSGLALDKDTGDVVWDSGRRGGGYSTPVIYRRRGNDMIAVLSNKALSGVDIATGEVAWTIAWGTIPAVNGADPVVSGTKAFVATGYGEGSALIDFSSRPRFVWRERFFDTHFSSLLLIDGYLYGNDGDARRSSSGKFRCVDFDTGEVMWTKQLGFGSLIAVDSYLIMLTSVGEIVIGEISPDEFVEVARGALPRNQYWTPPAFAHGRLIIRNLKGDLYCVDMR
jgi:outer membrane protein assembly factor BamB